MLPVFRRFSQADFPTAPDWLSGVFNPLNVFCETAVQTLNKNLTIGQNVQGQKFSTQFTTLATYATGEFTPISFAYNSNGQPNCLLIGNIYGGSILTPISITSWSLNINVNPAIVTVNYIAGLAPSTKYNIVLLAI
jgi:hypothetical protein